MEEVKHCFNHEVKQYVIPSVGRAADNQAMLDDLKKARLETAARIRTAMDGAKPRITSAYLSTLCQVTPQAVNGWRKTGRIHKQHLEKLAKAVGKPVEHFMGADPAVGTTHRKTEEKRGAYRDADLQMVIDAWRHLMPEERTRLREDVVSKAEYNRAVVKEMGHAPKHPTDEQVGKAYYPARRAKS